MAPLEFAPGNRRRQGFEGVGMIQLTLRAETHRPSAFVHFLPFNKIERNGGGKAITCRHVAPLSPRCRIARIALLLVGLAAWAGAAPLRLLILSVANNHDWPATTMKNEGFVRLLRRGTEWAATGAVSSTPSPLPK